METKSDAGRRIFCDGIMPLNETDQTAEIRQLLIDLMDVTEQTDLGDIIAELSRKFDEILKIRAYEEKVREEVYRRKHAKNL